MSDDMTITGTFHAGAGVTMRLATERSVYRYRLPITDLPEIELPEGARVLSVGPPRDGRDELDLWALVSPGAPLRRRTFRVAGTGHPVPIDPGAFLGSVTTHGGDLVWHVWAVA